MKSILDPACRPLVRRFLTSDSLMAFDYDGTLAPIAADPAEAHMRPSTRELLASVARRHPTVVITGRSRMDALGLLAGVPLLEVIGNHGFEAYAAIPAHFTRRVARWHTALAARLSFLPGAVIEDKRYSLAIHYRRCANLESARDAIISAAADLEGARLVNGKVVVNIVPAEARDKGDALLHVCRRLGCGRALFVGDDDTDEDVFALGRPDTVLGIRVGASDESAAAYSLNDQGEVDELLALLAMRSEQA